MISWADYCKWYKIPTKFQSAKIEDFEGFSQIKEFATKLVSGKGNRSAVLFGPPGRGKTRALYALERAVVEVLGGDRIRHSNAITIDEEALRQFNEFGSCTGLIEAHQLAEYLFVDDFGSERSSERVVRNYFDIINARWENDRPTIISTNLSPGLIEERFGIRTYDRLRDAFFINFAPFPNWRGLGGADGVDGAIECDVRETK